LYADGEIQWTTGGESGGTNGTGGIPAQVGFNAGDGVNFAVVPASRTPDIINIDTRSNIGIPGVWIFQISEERIVTASGKKVVHRTYAASVHIYAVHWFLYTYYS